MFPGARGIDIDIDCRAGIAATGLGVAGDCGSVGSGASGGRGRAQHPTHLGDLDLLATERSEREILMRCE